MTLKFEAIKSNGGVAIQEIAVLIEVIVIINFVIIEELSVTGCSSDSDSLMEKDFIKRTSTSHSKKKHAGIS